MKIAFVTDAYDPYISGVVTTAKTTAHHLAQMGHQVTMVVPGEFQNNLKLPELEVVLMPDFRIGKRLKAIEFDSIHIDTEGPLGWAAKWYCLRHRLNYTTSYHTQWPQYLQQRYRLPEFASWAVVRAFHQAASAVMVPSEAQRDELVTKGFNNVVLHGRGFDPEKFYPNPDWVKSGFDGLPRPIWLSVGRVSKEKNLEAMLSANVPGTMVIVGDGPEREALQNKFPQARFLGVRRGEELREVYAGADYFCFPSQTDTFGLVNPEALACGVPVVSHSQMPIAQLRQSPVTVIDDDYQRAMQRAAQIYTNPATRITPQACAAFARENFSWEAATRQFMNHLVPARRAL